MKKETPTIGLGLYTGRDLGSWRIGESFLSLLSGLGPMIAPVEIDVGGRWKTIEHTDLQSLRRKWEQGSSAVFRRLSRFESHLAVVLRGVGSGLCSVDFFVDEGFFRRPEHVQQFLRLGEAIYDLVNPIYGHVHDTRDSINLSTINDPKYGRTMLPVNLDKGLPGPYWANYLGPGYVAKLGKTKLLSAPCYQVRELADGGVLLLIAASPLNPATEANRSAQKRLREYLGDDLFYP